MSKKYGLNTVQGCTAGNSIEQALNLRAGEYLCTGIIFLVAPPCTPLHKEMQGIRGRISKIKRWFEVRILL